LPIPKSVVDHYLNLPVDNKGWYKKLKPLEVEQDLSYINPPHNFTAKTLRLDQKICFLLGVAYPEIMFQSDLGLGKSLVSLELISYFYTNSFVRRCFVFAPTNEVAEGWEDEIKKWGFDLPYIRLTQSLSKDKWAALEGFDKGIIIGTYIGISAMVSTLVPAYDNDGHPTGKNRREVDFQLKMKLLSQVDMAVFDQSTATGSKDSLTFEVMKGFSIAAKYRFALAGRAFGRDPFILWSQLFLTDHGKALGRSIGMFREAFWRREKHSFGTKWIFRKRREPILAVKIAASSIRYSTPECVDLPPKSKIIKYCTFPDENWDYYNMIREELIASRGNYREVKNSFLRMRQLSSGFIGFKDDDTGEKAQIEFQHNPKLDLLLELIEELPEDSKAVIFHEFTYSGSLICRELTKRKFKYGWLWSGTKNWTPMKEAFNTDPDYRFLVVNWKKGAMGLNLQYAAAYMMMYETPTGAWQREECEGRIWRTGQTNHCFIYDLVVRDTVDEDILVLHKDGRDLFKALVENPVKLLKRKGNQK
jgi:hypothetical protein